MNLLDVLRAADGTAVYKVTSDRVVIASNWRTAAVRASRLYARQAVTSGLTVGPSAQLPHRASDAAGTSLGASLDEHGRLNLLLTDSQGGSTTVWVEVDAAARRPDVLGETQVGVRTLVAPRTDHMACQVVPAPTVPFTASSIRFYADGLGGSDSQIYRVAVYEANEEEEGWFLRGVSAASEMPAGTSHAWLEAPLAEGVAISPDRRYLAGVLAGSGTALRLWAARDAAGCFAVVEQPYAAGPSDPLQFASFEEGPLRLSLSLVGR